VRPGSRIRRDELMGFHFRDWSTQAKKCWLAWHDKKGYGKVSRWRFQSAVALLDRLYLDGTDVAQSVWNLCQLSETFNRKRYLPLSSDGLGCWSMSCQSVDEKLYPCPS